MIFLIPVLFSFIVLVLYVLLAFWIFSDANKRGENAWLWLLLHLIAFVVADFVWILIRPNERDFIYEEKGR